jgi:NADH dehydrogenase
VTETIGILGGGGFVGRHLCCELARRGYRLRVLTRRRERRRDLLVYPTLQLVEADPYQADQLRAELRGCDALINLVGILNETGPGGFARAHVELPKIAVATCRDLGIGRYLHMSALGASPSAPSEYLRTKAEGEAVAHAAGGEGLRVTTFRPSVIFGRDDSFFNRFALLLKLSPLFFPLACPNARMSPVFIEDVALAFAQALENPVAAGRSYDLCGPRSYSLHELVELTARIVRLRRRVVGLNDRLSRLQARVLETVPGKPFSMDNYLSLQVDGVCQTNGFADLGIEPRGIEGIVPSYLGSTGRSARYQGLRGIARRN